MKVRLYNISKASTPSEKTITTYLSGLQQSYNAKTSALVVLALHSLITVQQMKTPVVITPTPIRTSCVQIELAPYNTFSHRTHRRSTPTYIELSLYAYLMCVQHQVHQIAGHCKCKSPTWAIQTENKRVWNILQPPAQLFHFLLIVAIELQRHVADKA